jgi:hypothetical protein
MKPVRLLIAALLLAIASGLFWWLNKKGDAATKSPAVTAAKSTSTTIVEVPQDQVQSLMIDRTGSPPLKLKKTAGKWSITAPKALAADQDAVSSVLSPLTSFTSDKLIEEKGANLNEFGLTQPSLAVTVTKQDGKTLKLLFGDDTPTRSGSYAELAGDPRVFVVPRYNKSSFEKTVDDLRDKRLLTVDSEKLSRVELTAKKETIEFGRSKDQWQILKPKPLRADQSAVDGLVRSIHDAKMELTAEDDQRKSLAAFNSGTPVATVKLTDVSGTQELQVRKNKDDYYTKSSVVAGIYKIAAYIGTSTDKSLEDFRNKKLFDFGFVDPDKIEMHDGTKSYFLTHSGSDWWSNGTKMDEGTVSTVVGAIRDLSATKFPDSGFTTASLEITVTSDSGKRVEKVLIAKNGDRYVAKRENEPALYELTTASVKDLQDSAAAMKPAPALPAKK